MWIRVCSCWVVIGGTKFCCMLIGCPSMTSSLKMSLWLCSLFKFQFLLEPDPCRNSNICYLWQLWHALKMSWKSVILSSLVHRQKTDTNQPVLLKTFFSAEVTMTGFDWIWPLLLGCFRYTWCLAFAATLQQLNELAAQKEDLAENLSSQIVCELTRYTQELKAERKTVSSQTHNHFHKVWMHRRGFEVKAGLQQNAHVPLEVKWLNFRICMF